jgi:hypothetical protein
MTEVKHTPRELALIEALKAAIRIADEARDEWDEAPSGIRAGKILIALSGGCPGYRADIDQIHEVLSEETAAVALAAAAPDLLEAAKMYMQRIKVDGESNYQLEAYEALAAAIAKAEDRS